MPVTPKGIYVIDHPDRDLPGMLWWGLNNTVHRNHQLYFVPMNEMSREKIVKIKPAFVVWNYARPANERLILFAKQMGAINIIHDTEGIPYHMETYFLSASEKLIQNLDIVLAWGAAQADFLQKKLQAIHPGIAVMNFGSIRYAYIQSLPKADLKDAANVIMWNTNFPSLKPRYQSAYAELTDAVVRDKFISGEAYVESLVQAAERRMRATLAIQDILQGNMPKLILRPHPFESIAYYEQTFGASNTRITYSVDKDIHEELQRVNLILHSGCQTTLDGFLRGVPACTLEPASNTNMWNQLSVKYREGMLNDPQIFETLWAQQAVLFEQANFQQYLRNFQGDLAVAEFVESLETRLRKRHLSVFIYYSAIVRAKILGLVKKILIRGTHTVVEQQRPQEKKKISTALILERLAKLTGKAHKSPEGFAVIDPHHLQGPNSL